MLGLMPPRTRSRPSSRRSGPVTVTRLGVDALVPEARKVALRLAAGDATRVLVLSPTEAIVK